MKILAFEFSTSRRSVAVVEKIGSAPAPRHGAVGNSSMAEVVETSANADIPEMIDRALRGVGLEREQIELLAVGLGPGSYTGVRTSIALAQGWQLARSVPAIGVSSAEGLALAAASTGLVGRVNVVIDAQREEFYVAAYELSPDSAHETQALRIESLEQVRSRERSGELLVGPDVARWFPAARAVFPSAAFVAELALERLDLAPVVPMEPIYLRETSFVKAPPARPLPPESGCPLRKDVR
jgi:tRNA threonylcarbamoyladenosine biosynthesis protein TsaB